MNGLFDLAVVIPTFNEAGNVSVLAGIPAMSYMVSTVLRHGSALSIVRELGSAVASELFRDRATLVTLPCY